MMSAKHFVVKNLFMYYKTVKGEVKAVDDVSFSIDKGETITIIGESGCGKSSVAKAIIRLLPRNVSIYKGEIYLDNFNIMSLSEEEFRELVRWNRITYVPQAALNSLNPVLKIGSQMIEPLIKNRRVEKDEALRKAIEMLEAVGIPRDFVNRYPFELSGGMRQRVIIATALLTDPDLIILDEPTSSLDVLTQASIINLLKKIKRERKISMIFITHDIGLSSELADKVGVMYAGQIVEYNTSENFYKNPQHPYSQLLMASVPTLHEDKNVESIPGSPPSLLNPPMGCRFQERCPYRFDKCIKDPPPILLDDEFYAKCWLYAKV
ncbi:MAG: ABC transporter ATP-binding protein [Thaumarchaeota archaeon]|jgi:peptide/nickel transport system ATP-binding protein|nr:ABC transporter ATP-binding protein [Candidatus Geocrenenecus arthurdayi]